MRIGRADVSSGTVLVGEVVPSIGEEDAYVCAEGLNSLDRKYFKVITVNEYDVTVMSWNTGHYWYLHNPEYLERGTMVLFHRHLDRDPYHYQRKERSLMEVVRYIRNHDQFQLNGCKW